MIRTKDSMSQRDHSVEPRDIAKLVDRLALDLVLTEGPPESGPPRVAASLVAIREAARAGGYSEVAELSTSLLAPVGQVVDGALGWDAIENTVQSGLAELQKSIAVAGMAPVVAAPLSLQDDPELVSDFVLETSEHITSIETNVLILEREPLNADAIHSVFRSFHTVKGLAGFLEFQDIREVAHEVETVLDLARNNDISITAAVIDTVLSSTDYLKLWVESLHIRLSGKVSQAPAFPHHLVAKIRELRPLDQTTQVPEKTAPLPQPVTSRDSLEAVPEVSEPARRVRAGEARTVKVDTAKLDSLVDMVGEMVIAQSLVRHDPDLSGVRTPRLLRNLSQLARTTDELQKTAMSMRMVPIGQLFQKMQRLTRDLARKSDKQVEVQTAGEDTELDRNLVEELADPMMHMIRNAVDHGLEPADERVAAGKPQIGRVRLTASHQAGHIVIELSDDGRGLNKERILRKAREKGLIEQSTILSDFEIYNLIFRPGFSTAEKVTDVSGRGVGMDVVRKQLQKLRGRVEIKSAPGEGTTFTMKLPLTLAIIDGLVVGVGSERYIVPLFSVREVLRPTPEMINTVEGRAEMALVRDRLMPVIRLHRRFRIKPRSEDPCACVLVISENAGRCFGLMVDELIGKQEVVIKNLGESLKNIQGVAGGAILGDGRVGLVLDVDGIFGVGEDPAHG
jgi:two-component system chemotaxis sensor kinase CheA